MMGSSSFRMPSLAIVVFTALAIGAAVLMATAIASLREVHPSTWAAIALAFAWALISMIIAGTYAIATGRRVGRWLESRRGTVVSVDPLGQNRTGFELRGPGAEIVGAEDVAVTNKVPAVLLVLSSIALAIFLFWCWRSGRTTGYGTLIAELLPFYMMNWARNAWPRFPETNDSCDISDGVPEEEPFEF
jgi:hypothetical protein